MRSIHDLFVVPFAICLLGFGQPAQLSPPPRAILVRLADALPYLRVDDCTLGTQCRQLDRDQSVAVAEGFMFFSVFSTGVDLKAHHVVQLKIAGFAIPGALNALLPEDPHTQRFNFIVDLQRYKRLPAATPKNIEVRVDGKIITPRVVDR